GPDRDRGDFEGSPVDGTPEFGAVVWTRDFVTLDLIADRHRADVPAADVVPDRGDVLALAEAHAGQSAAVLDASRARHHRTDHRLKCEPVMHLEKRRTGVEAIEMDLGRVHAQLLVERLAEERLAPNSRTGRPHDLD